MLGAFAIGAVALALAEPRLAYAGAVTLVALAIRFWDVGDLLRELRGPAHAVGWALLLTVPSTVVVGLVADADATEMLLDAVIVGALTVGAVLAADQIIGAAQRRKRLRQPIIVLGGPPAGELHSRLAENHHGRLVPVAAVRRTRPLLTRDVEAILASRTVHGAFVFEEAMSTSQADEIIDVLLSRRVEVFVRPAHRSWRRWGAQPVSLEGTAFVVAQPPGFAPYQRRIKRLMDITVSAGVLLLLLPLLALVAVAVKVSSPGSAVFRQRRLGQYGQPFELLKFRSMREHESDTEWHPTDDELITPVGRFIRATSIDELPQLINVLRGDMSLVGPRPERPYFASQFADIPGYADRLRLPVGLTGLAQIQGLRGDTSIPERVRFDNHYIETASLTQDLGIMARTVTKLRMPEPDLVIDDVDNVTELINAGDVELDLTDSELERAARRHPARRLTASDQPDRGLEMGSTEPSAG